MTRTKTKTQNSRSRSTNRNRNRSRNKKRNALVSTRGRVSHLTVTPGQNRHRNRRRNPQVKSLVVGALWAGAGAWVTGIIAGFIPIGGGGWMDILKMGVAAYGTGFIAERFTSPANAQLMAIGGFAGAAMQALNMVLGMGGSIFSSLGPHQPAPPVQVVDGSGAVHDVLAYPEGMGYIGGMGDLVEAPEEYEVRFAGNG